jgi:hypothetical protein
MAFSIPASVQAIMTGAIDDVWRGTPGLLAEVTVYKEPIQNIIYAPENNLFGYGNEQANNNQVTLTPVYNTFSGQIVYPTKPKGQNEYFDRKIQLEPNKVYLRCRQDLRDYIENGEKTVNLQADSKTWNLVGNYQEQNFLNLKFYYFEIEATN